MAQVLPAERDLRRVIGDGDAVPDREVEGLTDHDLVELYRSLVLLRTYDERSVVYHRQGRIGTYAIFWNHEAIQAGSAYALDDDDWIFPSYRESAIGLLRGMPVSTVLSWWRGHPAGWWNPADYNVASICVPIGDARPARGRARVGQEAARREGLRDRVLRRRRHLRGRLPRGREPRRGDGRAARPALQQQPVGDLDAARGADPRRDPGRQGGRLRDARACAWTGSTCSPCSRRRARRSSARGRATGRPSSRPCTTAPAPHATADDPKAYIDLERVEEERARECVGRFEGYLRRAGILTDEMAESIKGEAAERMREGIAAAEAEPPADPALLFEHAFVDPPASFERDLAELRRILGSELG